MPRTILHLDLDAFFCAVEETLDPSLSDRPFAVGGKPDERGVVSSCSYAARALGVRSAMPMSRALRVCPGLLVIEPHYRLYSQFSRRVMERLGTFTPLLEQISIDEAFLDISDRREPADRIGREIQGNIRDELRLPSSVGIASNKLVAKIATEVGKKAGIRPKAVTASTQSRVGPPCALTIVPPGEEADFLAPLPAEMLWGVGPKTAKRLGEFGIHTIGDIARWPEAELTRLFGEHGRDLSRHARGLDERPIVTEYEVKSISQERTFVRDVSNDKKLVDTLRELSMQVARRLRKNDLTGTTVKLKLRWPDFTTLTRQTRLPQPTDQEGVITSTATTLLKSARRSGQAVRLVGVGVSGLGPPIRQLSLWEEGGEKSRRLQEAVDALQEKYGTDVIHKGKQGASNADP